MEEGAVIANKLIHKMALHKFVNNGGAIKVENFGIRINYNDKYPGNPMVEVQIFAIPKGGIFTGNINPSLARAQATQKKKDDAKDAFKLEEGEEIEM